MLSALLVAFDGRITSPMGISGTSRKSSILPVSYVMKIVSPLSYYSFGFFEDEPVPPKDFLNRLSYQLHFLAYDAADLKLTPM